MSEVKHNQNPTNSSFLGSFQQLRATVERKKKTQTTTTNSEVSKFWPKVLT